MKMFFSTDTNAPQLTSDEGSACDLFKICLTQGYLGRQAAEWSVHSQTSDSIYIKDINGKILYVKDTGDSISFCGFENELTIGDFSKALPNSNRVASGLKIRRSSVWSLFASATYLYLICDGVLYFFGTFRTMLREEEHVTAIIGLESESSTPSFFSAVFTTAAGSFSEKGAYGIPFQTPIGTHSSNTLAYAGDRFQQGDFLGFSIMIHSATDVIGMLPAIWALGATSQNLAVKSKYFTYQSVCLYIVQVQSSVFAFEVE